MNSVKITWYGHSCFSIEYNGYCICIDPYEDGYVPGLTPIRLEANAVYCTHEHGDHNGRENVRILPADLPEDFSVSEYGCAHDDAGGTKRGMSKIYRFTFGDKVIVHMGDVGCFPEQAVLDQISSCDLLMIPIGGYYTIDAEQAVELIREIAPRRTVPMHYRGKGFGFREISDNSSFLAHFETAYVLSGSAFILDEKLPTGLVVPAYNPKNNG